MEIYGELKSDHRTIKSILKKLDDTTEKSIRQRQKLLKQLKEILVPHARAEEQVLYERLKVSPIKEADALAFEGFEEHAVVDRLMDELASGSPDDKRWTALVSVVKESLEHHIEEEEKEIFKKAHQTFDRALAIEMAEQFLALKAVFLKEVKRGKNPAPKPSHERVGARAA